MLRSIILLFIVGAVLAHDHRHHKRRETHKSSEKSKSSSSESEEQKVGTLVDSNSTLVKITEGNNATFLTSNATEIGEKDIKSSIAPILASTGLPKLGAHPETNNTIPDLQSAGPALASSPSPSVTGSPTEQPATSKDVVSLAALLTTNPAIKTSNSTALPSTGLPSDIPSTQLPKDKREAVSNSTPKSVNDTIVEDLTTTPTPPPFNAL